MGLQSLRTELFSGPSGVPPSQASSSTQAGGNGKQVAGGAVAIESTKSEPTGAVLPAAQQSSPLGRVAVLPFHSPGYLS